jgi:predicted anti-sigma-YlaC factor YlaD
MTHLTCREMTDFLADYLGGSLGLAERHVFDEHLADCPECVAYLRSYAETIRLAGHTREDDPGPDNIPDALVRAILAAWHGGHTGQ